MHEAALTDGPLRGIVVGLGVMGSHHLRILDSTPGVKVPAVVDPVTSLRTSVLQRHPHIAVYETFEQALADHEADFVCLAVPVEALPACTVSALERDLHVFVEKPMAPSEEQAREMIAAARESGRTLGVGYVERFNPAVVALKEKLDAGAIGRVVQMHARRLSPFPNRDRMAGVALDLATHDIDLMRSLSGSEVIRVSAESAEIGAEYPEDLICSTICFESGTTGLLEANWITPTKVRELTVLGEGGMFIVNYLTQELTFYEHPTKATEWDQLAGMRGGEEGDMVRYALERREPLRLQWEAFLDAVRQGKPAPVDGLDGLATLLTARAIRAAAAEHRVVSLSQREAPHV